VSDSFLFDALVAWLINVAGQNDRVEVSEIQLISYLEEEHNLDHIGARAVWESLSPAFRRRVVRDGYLLQWLIFRNVVQVSRLATAEEIQSTAEVYESTKNEELERRIRSLSGIEFERFLTTILGRRSEYRNISVTQISRDGGIDFRGHFVPLENEQLQAPLIGQAKQVSSPITAGVARDFIGALDTASEKRVYGLFVSTGGLTEPAITAIRRSRYPITIWDMGDLLKQSRGIATCHINISFDVPDQTFWEEVIGST